MELVQALGGSERQNSLLVAIATEPDNIFNAHFLHGAFLKMPMPERDKVWSLFVAGQTTENSTPIEILHLLGVGESCPSKPNPRSSTSIVHAVAMTTPWNGPSSVTMPAPWLADALSLRLSNGRHLTFVNDADNTMFSILPSLSQDLRRRWWIEKPF